MKMWKCIAVVEFHARGWTVGKVYQESNKGYLVDNEEMERLQAITYNEAGLGIEFTEVSFEIYLKEIENDNTINS